MEKKRKKKHRLPLVSLQTCFYTLINLEDKASERERVFARRKPPPLPPGPDRLLDEYIRFNQVGRPYSWKVDASIVISEFVPSNITVEKTYLEYF